MLHVCSPPLKRYLELALKNRVFGGEHPLFFVHVASGKPIQAPFLWIVYLQIGGLELCPYSDQSRQRGQTIWFHPAAQESIAAFHVGDASRGGPVFSLAMGGDHALSLLFVESPRGG